MQDCARHKADIDLLLKSERLGLEGEEELEIHLAKCDLCSERYSEVQSLFVSLDRLPWYQPSFEFDEKVLAEINLYPVENDEDESDTRVSTHHHFGSSIRRSSPPRSVTAPSTFGSRTNSERPAIPRRGLPP